MMVAQIQILFSYNILYRYKQSSSKFHVQSTTNVILIVHLLLDVTSLLEKKSRLNRLIV